VVGWGEVGRGRRYSEWFVRGRQSQENKEKEDKLFLIRNNIAKYKINNLKRILSDSKASLHLHHEISYLRRRCFPQCAKARREPKSLKGPCHEIFDLWFFFIKQSHLGPRFTG
jgi:hypothetical protein